jgi:hypothetical protein
MPDFEVNEGYVEAGHGRAHPDLPELRADGLLFADDRGASEDRDAAPEEGHKKKLGRALGEAAARAQAEEERRKLPEETPIVRRTRHLATGHLSANRRVAPRRRVGVTLIARRRRLARRACPYGWQVRVLGTPPRHCRRLWTMCHGPEQLPGSPS